jgi:uncharacterized membrane protein HdeD (DUF308 family)
MATSTTLYGDRPGSLGGPVERLADDVLDGAETVTRNWWLPLLTGIAWTILSLIIFRFDSSSVTAVSVLFGVVAVASGANEFFRSYLSSGGWRLGHVLLGVLCVAAGTIAFLQPWTTFVGLAAVVGFFLIFNGTFDLIQAFGNGRDVQGSWLLGLSGLVELLLGFWAAGSWGVSAVVLVAWVGASALIRGITEIAGAFQLREVRAATR